VTIIAAGCGAGAGATTCTIATPDDGRCDQGMCRPPIVRTTDLQPNVGAGGPQPDYFFYDNGLFGSLEYAFDWLVRIVGSGNVNPATQGMGVGDNLFSAGEFLHFELDDEGASTYGAFMPDLVYALQIGVVGLDPGELLQYQAVYTNGTAAYGSVTVGDVAAGGFTVGAPDGTFLDAVDVIAGAATTVRFTSLATFQ
jgi:hypothetical protein